MSDDSDDRLTAALETYHLNSMRSLMLAKTAVGQIEAAIGQLSADDEVPVGFGLHVDVVRSAIVFLHAAQEEFYREVARVKLPEAGVEALSDVPHAGLPRKKGAERSKVHLGHLVKYRSLTVDDYIRLSIDEYMLSAFNVSSVDEIASLAEKLKVDLTPVRDQFPRIEWLIRRRHHIVHRGDPFEVEPDDVRKWALEQVASLFVATDSTRRLAFHFFVSLCNGNNADELIEFAKSRLSVPSPVSEWIADSGEGEGSARGS